MNAKTSGVAISPPPILDAPKLPQATLEGSQWVLDVSTLTPSDRIQVQISGDQRYWHPSVDDKLWAYMGTTPAMNVIAIDQYNLNDGVWNAWFDPGTVRDGTYEVTYRKATEFGDLTYSSPAPLTIKGSPRVTPAPEQVWLGVYGTPYYWYVNDRFVVVADNANSKNAFTLQYIDSQHVCIYANDNTAYLNVLPDGHLSPTGGQDSADVFYMLKGSVNNSGTFLCAKLSAAYIWATKRTGSGYDIVCSHDPQEIGEGAIYVFPRIPPQ